MNSTSAEVAKTAEPIRVVAVGDSDDQHDAGGEGQRGAGGVQPAAQLRLDLVEGLADLVADALGDAGGGGDDRVRCGGSSGQR